MVNEQNVFSIRNNGKIYQLELFISDNNIRGNDINYCYDGEFKLRRFLKMEKSLEITHESMTEEECYENVKRMWRLYPNIVMNPDKWKKLHDELKK
jgi:hypothetical protein